MLSALKNLQQDSKSPDGATTGTDPVAAGTEAVAAAPQPIAGVIPTQRQNSPHAPTQDGATYPLTADAEATTAQPQSIPATPDQSNKPSQAGLSAAELLFPKSGTATQPNAAILTSEQASTLFPTEDYGAYTAAQLHNANIENYKEGERLHGKFTAHLYDLVLPALNETIERLKRGEEINGYSGERQVGAYLESIGYSAELVRQWNKRHRDRMADLKKALGLTDGSGDSKLTPDQRELRDALMQQGYKNSEATGLAKAAEGTDLIERFNWVMAHRASQINGIVTNQDVGDAINTAADQSDPEPGSVTTVTHTEAVGQVPVATPAETLESLPLPTETLAPETATFEDWQKHQLPTPDYKLKYFAEASENFSSSYTYSFQKSGFKKIIETLRDKPDQVRSNAQDYALLATVLRGVAENANLLANLITTALTLSPGPQASEPEEQQSAEVFANRVLGGMSTVYCEGSSKVERPVQLENGGSTPTPSLQFARIEKAQATELIIKHHYLHRRCLISWAFGIVRDGEIVGVCTFGKPMWSVQVGVTGGSLWDVRKNKGRWRDVYELNRLWIADDVTDHCIESKFIGWCLRQLKKINPNLILVSYADTAHGHVGVIYKATGWIYTGVSTPWVDITIEGKDHRSVPKKMQGDKIGNRRTWAGVSTVRKKRSRKHRYVMFLDRESEGQLAWKRLPYPKNHDHRRTRPSGRRLSIT